MSVWQTIARDFGWKPLFKGEDNAYPCGATQGWARPISLDPSEGQFEDVGCVCHANIEHTLAAWETDLATKLRHRISQVPREARHRWFGLGRSKSILPPSWVVDGTLAKLGQLQLRLRVQRDLEMRHEPADRPAPLAGRPTWTDVVYRPR